MVAAGAMGTSADLVYGYLVECAQFREDSPGKDISLPTAGSKSD